MFTIGIHLSRAPSGALWLSSVDPVSTRLVSYTSKCEREDARTALSRTTDSSATFSWCSGRGGGGGGALIGSADSLTKTVANTGVAVNIEEFPRSAGIGAFGVIFTAFGVTTRLGTRTGGWTVTIVTRDMVTS